MDQTVHHILRTSPGQEAAVLKSIDNAEVYLPIQVVRKFNRRYRAWTKYDMPLFPGYLFVNIDEPLRLRTIGASAHVRGFLRNADRSYALLAEKHLEAVRRYEQDMREGLQNLKHPFRPNAQVEFVSGAFSGFKAVVTQLEGLQGLEVNIVGSTLTVHTTASQVREAPSGLIVGASTL